MGCPPCRNFTPELVNTYKLLNNGDKKRLEIIFISCDRDEKSYNEYFETMPWLSIGFQDKKRESALSNHFDVNGIPCFVLLDPKDMSIINSNAVGKVRADKEGLKFPWLPEPVKEIDAEPEGIDEGLSLVVLQESLEEKVQEDNKEIVKKIALKYKNTKLNDNDILFFSASKEGHLANRVRDACDIKDESNKDKVKVVMMNIPENSYYEYTEDSLSAENIESFFNKYKNNELSTKPMGA